MLPYHGAFEYRTGHSAAFVDVNRILYVTGGREFADRHVAPNLGHASIIITPRKDLLDELCGTERVEASQAFAAATRPNSPRTMLLTHRLRALRAGWADTLAREELTLEAMRESLGGGASRPAPGRIVDRAKQVLHARGGETISLDEIARDVGVSPIYLTQEFTRSEGIPLYRYHLRLRLADALAALPDCNDITALALDLGFSSHSHFGFAFRSTFRMTPSQFRNSVRAGAMRPAPGRAAFG